MAQNGCVPFSAQSVLSQRWHKTVVCHFRPGAIYCEPKMAQNGFVPFLAQLVAKPKLAENGFAKNV